MLEATAVRYRDAYNTRHSFISWRLMMGDNVLLVAQEDGHSVQTMLTTYAAWTKGATEADVAAIKRAITCPPTPFYKEASPAGPLESPGAMERSLGCH